MSTAFVDSDGTESDIVKAFGRLINLSLEVATTDRPAKSPYDDLEAIPFYRKTLEKSCSAAARAFGSNPSLETIVWHTLVLQGDLVELIGAAPLILKASSLTIRSYLCEIHTEFAKDRDVNRGA